MFVMRIIMAFLRLLDYAIKILNCINAKILYVYRVLILHRSCRKYVYDDHALDNYAVKSYYIVKKDI